MKKIIKRLSVVGLLMLSFSLLTVKSYAEDGQLLYDLRYDESKSVLYGKTKPNANVYINDLAGNIVADSNGDFEMPVPKGLKVSTVLMLDAEGDTSTDVRFNFEKNTIETQQTNTPSESSKPGSSSETKKEESSKEKESDSKETKEKESETKDSDSETKDSESQESTDSSAVSSSLSISSESYDSSDFEEEKRSLIWLWTLLIVVGVLGLAAASYLWYKKKLEKEEAEKEARRRKRGSKNRGKHKKSLDDDFEDDLYASLKSEEIEKEKKVRSSRSEKISESNLDDLIDSELKRNQIDTEGVKTSRTRNGKKRRRKTTDK